MTAIRLVLLFYLCFQNPCDKLKCSNGGKCRANYVNNTGECQCELGFVGDTCDERCDVTPLGMGDYRIPDSSLAASSSWNSQLHPTCGRLRRGWDDKCRGGWHARQSQVEEFLQVYLGNLTLISKVATQGRAPDSRQHTHQYVTSYGLDYSLDVYQGPAFYNSLDIDTQSATTLIFPGNSNLDGIVTHTLAERLVTRYVRFMVKTWRLAIVMRVELYGCRYVTCYYSLGCDVTPLGMGDYRIPDSSLAASSSWNSQLHPTCGRLRRGWDDKCRGGWHARQSQVEEFLQVYLGNLTLISKVATQDRAPDSRQHTHQYVTSYGLDYSLDVSNWESYKENGTVKIFPGNSNLDGIVTHTLAERLVTRYVRFM
ncbi:predicted protein, partial [Nematostella vectensis]